MKCPHCNQEHTDDTKVCPITGEAILHEAYCPNCGQNVEPQWEVCLNCGTLLDHTNPAEITKPLMKPAVATPLITETPYPTSRLSLSDTQPIKIVASAPEQERVYENSVPPASSPYKSRRKRTFRWWTCGCLGVPLTLLLLVALFALTDPFRLNLWGRLSGRYDAAAQVMPENTGVYLGINVGNILLTRLDRVLTPFSTTGETSTAPTGFNYRPAKVNPSSIQAANSIDNLLQQFEMETGVNIPADLNPWIGQYAGAGIVDFRQTADGLSIPNGWIIAIETRSNPRADAFLETLRGNLTERQGITFNTEIYQGVKLNVQSNSTTGSALAFGRAKRMLLVASGLDILKQAIDTQSNPLPAEAGYKQLIRARPRSWSASIYVNRSLAGNITSDIQQSTGLLSSAMQLINPLPASSWTSMLVNATAIRNGLRIDSYTTIDPSTQAAGTEFIQSLNSPHEQVIQRLPQDTLLFMSGARFDLAWQSVLGPYLSGGPGDNSFLHSFEGTFGFSLQDELLDRLQGQWTLYAFPSDRGVLPDQMNTNVAIGLLAQADNNLDLQSIAAKLEQGTPAGGMTVESKQSEGGTYYELAGMGTRDPILAFGLEDGYFSLSTDAQIFQAPGDRGLTSSTAYRTAENALPGGVQPSFYVDVARLFAQLREGMQAVERENFDSDVAFFDPIESIASGNRMAEPGVVHNSLVVLLKER